MIKITGCCVLFILPCLSQAGDLIFKHNFEISTGCDTSVYPPGLNKRENYYATINDGYPFGESTNATFLLNLRNYEFVALRNFSFPQLNSRRRIVFAPAPTEYNLMNQGTLSISECPGDFSSSAVCVVRVHNNKTVFVTTKPNEPATFCTVDPNKIYYINYVLSPDPYHTAPSCNNPNHIDCAMFYSESL